MLNFFSFERPFELKKINWPLLNLLRCKIIQWKKIVFLIRNFLRIEIFQVQVHVFKLYIRYTTSNVAQKTLFLRITRLESFMYLNLLKFLTNRVRQELIIGSNYKLKEQNSCSFLFYDVLLLKHWILVRNKNIKQYKHTSPFKQQLQHKQQHSLFSSENRVPIF